MSGSSEVNTSLNDHELGPLLLWADCEFTGIKVSKGHKILEIGAVVTDLALREQDSFHSFIHYDWQRVENLMATNEWWDDRIADKQRMRQGLQEAPSVEEVDVQLAQMIREYFSPEEPPALCGNSISNDKHHIDEELPHTSELLNYRVIDVSSLKLIAQKYQGVEYTDKLHKHYAMDDIYESLDEFRFLITKLGIADLGSLVIRNS